MSHGSVLFTTGYCRQATAAAANTMPDVLTYGINDGIVQTVGNKNSGRICVVILALVLLQAVSVHVSDLLSCLASYMLSYISEFPEDLIVNSLTCTGAMQSVHVMFRLVVVVIFVAMAYKIIFLVLKGNLLSTALVGHESPPPECEQGGTDHRRVGDSMTSL